MFAKNIGLYTRGKKSKNVVTTLISTATALKNFPIGVPVQECRASHIHDSAQYIIDFTPFD